MFFALLFAALSCSLVNSYSVEKQLPPQPKPLATVRYVNLRDTPPPIPIPTFESDEIPSIPHGGKPDPKQSSTCGNTNYAFTAPGQTASLTAPGYPYNYATNLNCSYSITSPVGTTMKLSCDTFYVQCPDSFLVSTGDNLANANSYCGWYFPTQSTTGNTIAIGFKSGWWPAFGWGNTFRCTVTVSGTQPSTTTVSPPVTGSTSGPLPGSSTISPPPSSCTCGVRNVNGATRIVGGVQTQTGELPWRVAVFIYNPATSSGAICGGTIISANWVMTAAHCTNTFKPGYKISVYTEAQANPISVGSGVNNPVDTYVQNPGFNPNTMDNDISLLHLATPLTFKSDVSPSCLPWNMVGNSYQGYSVLASGWGTTQPVAVGAQNNDATSPTLLEVVLPVLSTTECQQYLSMINDNQICTYLPGKDTCQGDSGGSIDYQNSTNQQYYSIGVVSWGYGCAQRGNPGVYTKVSNYLSWIQATTVDTFCNN